MKKSLPKLCFLLLLLFTQLSFSIGEKYTSIVVSKEVDESHGRILLNVSLLYFNTTRIEIPQGQDQPPKIVEKREITSIEDAPIYISFYDTSYTKEGKLEENLVPLPCSPVITSETYEEDDKIVYYGLCVIDDEDGKLYSKYFKNKCTGLDFYFPGMSLPTESIPPTETTKEVCTGKPAIFEALKGILASTVNPEDPFCISMFIIFGLLLSTLFFAGRSPLSLLDMLTPILPKPKRFAYAPRLHGAGHKKIKEGAKKVISAFDKQVQKKEKGVNIPDKLRSLYDKAPQWKRMLVLKALKEGDVDLAGRILRADLSRALSIATARWGKDDIDLMKVYEYIYMMKVLDAYAEIGRVSKNKYVNKVLGWMGKQYLLMEIPAMLGSAAMTVRFVKRAVKAPFIRRGELKRLKKVREAKTPVERRAAMAALEEYREEKGIKPVNRLFDPIVFGEELHRMTKEQAAKEAISYMLLMAFDKAGISRKSIDKAFAELKKGIVNKNQEGVKQAIKKIEDIITKIDNIDPAYKDIIERIRNVYSQEGDPYAKVFGVLSILEKENIMAGRELVHLKKYIRELSSIDRQTNTMDIQKFLETAMYIKEYRKNALLGAEQVKGWYGFVPSLFTPEGERKGIAGSIFSTLFANELLSQVKVDLSRLSRFFFGLRAINPLFPLMEYELLPSDFKKWVKEQKLDGVYKEISSFSSRMFDELVGRTYGLRGKDAINAKIASLMKDNHVRNKFALLGGVWKGLNTRGDWHVSSPHYAASKVPRITTSAFGRALELSYIGRVKESFENAFQAEAFMLPFSYYSVITKNLVNDFAFQLGSVGYYSMRHHVAEKLGVDVDALTDTAFRRFIKNKKNLDLYLTDLDKGSFILMKGWGAIPFVQDVLNPDPSNLGRYFADKKIQDYLRDKLGYGINNRMKQNEIYARFAAKGGIGLPDSFINTTILVNVDGKFRVWKGKELSNDKLYKLDSMLVKKKQKIGPHDEVAEPGDFAKLYKLAEAGDEKAFNKVKNILIENKRMDVFMALAAAYQESAKGVSRAEAFKGITDEYVKYVPLEKARNEAKAFMDRVRLWTERTVSGAAKPVVYAGIPYWEAMGTMVAASEVARKLGVEYVDKLNELSKEELKREKEFATAVKDFEHAWQWTITRDALLYGGFERYGRPGYFTTGFHIGPAMPVSHWMDRRSFSPLFQNIPILGKVMRTLAITTFKLSVGVSRPFVLGARAIGFHRYKRPSAYDIRMDIHESNPFVSTQEYYPVNSTLPRVPVGATLLQGFSALISPVLAGVGFFKEMREKKETALFYRQKLSPGEKVVPSGAEGTAGVRIGPWILRGRVVDAIKNSIARATELKFVHPVAIRRLGIANLDIYVGAPRPTDMYWFYSPSMANIGDADTNPGLSYIQSYTGQYVWQPLVGRVLERHGVPVLPRLREQMFDVHEKRTISALGLAAYYYTETHWADPFNFRNNPLYSILSPGIVLLSLGGWGRRKLYRMKYERKVRKTEKLYRRLHASGPITDWDRLKMGGVKLSKGILDYVKGEQERWVRRRTWVECPVCHTKHYGLGPCPRCGYKTGTSEGI